MPPPPPRAPRALLIDPSVAHPEVECAQVALAGWDMARSTILLPALRPGDRLAETHYEHDGVILLGSAASVHDDLEWQHELVAWLEPLLDGSRPLPLLAICYGHQLLAHLAGAEVGFVHEDGHKRLGIETSELLPSRLAPEAHALRVVASHCELPKSVPPGYRVIARREGVPIDGLEHEELPIWSFQFHPEARGQFLADRSLDPALALEVAPGCDELLASFRRVVEQRLV